MGYIALEEAFAVPELADRQPVTEMRIRVTDSFAAVCGRKLVDFEEHRLPEMDECGIDAQVLSLTTPGIQADTDPTAARENARLANDFLAEVVARHPTRFHGFAALPTQDPAAAVAELERRLHLQRLVAAVQARALERQELAEVAEDQGRRGVTVEDAGEDQPQGVPAGLGLPAPCRAVHFGPSVQHVPVVRRDRAGVQVQRNAQLLQRAPQLGVGGVVEVAAVGVIVDQRSPESQLGYGALERSPSSYIGSNILVTTSGVLAPEAIHAAVLTTGEDAVMFSADYPYEDTAAAVAAVEKSGLSAEVRQKVASGNARRVLRLPSI